MDELERALRSAGFPVWRDTADLWPGQDWGAIVRRSIIDGTLVFLACFSSRSAARRTRYQIAELALAAEQARLRQADDSWLIPVRFDECKLPDLDLGGGRRLAGIQRADLFGDQGEAAAGRLLAAIARILGTIPGVTALPEAGLPGRGRVVPEHVPQRPANAVRDGPLEHLRYEKLTDVSDRHHRYDCTPAIAVGADLLQADAALPAAGRDAGVPWPAGSVVGERGNRELAEAIESVDESFGTAWCRARGPWDIDSLRLLESELAALDGPAVPAWGRHEDERAWARQAARDARAWALQVAGRARIALETARLLSGRGLGPGRLRDALFALPRLKGQFPRLPPCGDLIEAAEAAAFSGQAEDCRERMAQFVLFLLAPETGEVGAEDTAFWSWVNAIGGEVQLESAGSNVRAWRRRQHLRLAVSLHDAPAGPEWPQQLDAWLVLDGEPQEHRRFACAAAGQRGAEDALAEAVGWAKLAARQLGWTLQRVDVAAPAGVLLRWRPELALAGGSLLGVRHDVVVHWSARLDPSAHGWFFDEADWRWPNISGCKSGAPVDWLSARDTKDAQGRGLAERFRAGHFERVVGLDHHPADEVMELLLAYLPVVLWPATDNGFPAARRRYLRDHWASLPSLPAALSEAYRLELRGKKGGALAALRATWDDPDWLRLCAALARTIDESRSGQ